MFQHSDDEFPLAATLERWTGLDATRLPAFRERILLAERMGIEHQARDYPGYPQVSLGPVRARPWPSLEKALTGRRSWRHLASEQPPLKRLARLLRLAHGCNGDQARGPTPSAGGLQALELYLVVLGPGTLEPGIYHFNRQGGHLSRLALGANRDQWQDYVPSLSQFRGGALLWVLVGDGSRVCEKYGARGYRFLLLEAGHLMQNLCLLGQAQGLCTLPLGGFMETPIRHALGLPESDFILYLGACGRPLQDQR